MRLEEHVGDEEDDPGALWSVQPDLERARRHAEQRDAGVVDQRGHISTALLARVGRVQATWHQGTGTGTRQCREERVPEHANLLEWV